jgi:hypothetical protein
MLTLKPASATRGVIEDATESIKNKWKDNPEKGNIGGLYFGL